MPPSSWTPPPGSINLIDLRRPPAASHGRPLPTLLTLAIETSCDDTAVALLMSRTTAHPPTATLLFNERITSDHRRFQGVNPPLAARGHHEALGPLLARAADALPSWQDDAGMRRRKLPNLVAATRGPGCMANLAVGLSAAKGLAVAWNRPLLGVHHMQAHALTARLARALAWSERRHALQDKLARGTSECVAAADAMRKLAADMEGKATSGAPADDGLEVTGGPDFPFLSLLVSGAHTQLVLSTSLTSHRIIIDTADTAIGNALDQTARVILPAPALATSPTVMYARALEAFAFPPDDTLPAEQQQYEAFFRPAATRAEELADPPIGYPWTLPQPFRNSRQLSYSFSSLHSAVHAIAAAAGDMPLEERRALARHTLRAAFQHLASRLCLALDDSALLAAHKAQLTTLVLAGGVASNKFLRHVLRSTLAARGHGGLRLVAAPPPLCTDNAAMVAWAAAEMYDAGWQSSLAVEPIGKWSLDPERGGGMREAKGWLNTPRLSEDAGAVAMRSEVRDKAAEGV